MMMRSHIKEANVDLLQYPASNERRQHPPEMKNVEVTIGDLHGNALKLLYFLIKENILDLSEKGYKDIIEIYQKNAHELTEKDLKLFTETLASAKLLNPAKIRLIGDELADRGSNDYFTLKILEKLSQEKADIRILLSNHGGEFLRAYENNFDSFMANVGPGQARSLQTLGVLVDKGLVGKEEIKNIVKTHYKPTFKLIDYSLNQDNEISIYTHAPVGLNTIRAAAKFLNVVYNDSSSENLAKTIDRINAAAANEPKIFERSQYDTYGQSSEIAELTHPLVRLMWTRRSGDFHAELNNSIDPMDSQINNYKLRFVHGHDGHGVSINPEYITNLDNTLGKGSSMKGAYTIESAYNTYRPKLTHERIEESNQPEIRDRSKLKAMKKELEDRKNTLRFMINELQIMKINTFCALAEYLKVPITKNVSIKTVEAIEEESNILNVHYLKGRNKEFGNILELVSDKSPGSPFSELENAFLKNEKTLSAMLNTEFIDNDTYQKSIKNLKDGSVILTV